MRIKFWKNEPAPAFFDESRETATIEVEPEQFEPVSVEMTETAKTYNTVAGWIVAVTAFLLPLFFLPVSSSVLELNKQMFLVVSAGAALIVWLLGVVISGQMAIRLNPLDKGVGALLVGTALVSIFSLMRTSSIFGLSVGSSESLVTVLTLSILYFVAVNVFEDGGKRLVKLLSISSVIALIFGLIQMLTWYILPLSIAHSRVFNTVGTVNTLGLLAAIMLPLFSKIKVLIRSNKYLDVAKLGMVVGVIILAVLNWWVLWTVAIAGMLGVTALDSLSAASGDGRKWKVSRFLLPMTVIVLGVFLLIVNFNFTPVRSNLPVEIAPSFGLAGKVAASALKQRLVFGFGPENYSLAFDKFGAKSLSNSTLSGIKFFDSTAQVLNWVVHGGVVMILAVLLFLWALGEAFWKSLHLDYELSKSAEFSAVSASLIALVVALFLYPFNTTIFFVLYVMLAVLALMGWGSRRRVMNIEDKPAVSLASSIGFIVGLILVLAGTYFTSLRYVSDITYAKALKEQSSNAIVGELVKAINWNNQDDRYYRAISQATLNVLSEEINKKPSPTDTKRAERVSNLVQSSINLAKRATELAPLESDNWFNLGTVYQALIGLVDGVERLAEDSFNKGSELRPGDASFDNRTGSMYLARADLFKQLSRSAGANAPRFIQEANVSLGKAEKYFKLAVEKANNYGLAIYNLGAVYDRQGRTNESIHEIEKIIPYNASQPNLLFELGLLYYRVGRRADATAALERAVLLAPQYANARWYLALLREEAGDLPGAIAQLDKILETNDGNQVVLDKMAQLKAGQSVIPPQKVTDQKPLDVGSGQ